MHIQEEASEAKIKNQRWLQEFPSELREWKRFNGINCSLACPHSCFYQSQFLSYIYLRKRGKTREVFFYGCPCMVLWWFCLLKDLKWAKKGRSCDILVQRWWQDWHLQRELRQIRLYPGNNMGLSFVLMVQFVRTAAGFFL